MFIRDTAAGDITYGALKEAADQWSTRLQGLGVGRGDRVVVMLPNSWKSVAAWLGIAQLGAVEVPINTAYLGRMLHHASSLVEPKIIITHVDFLERFATLEEPLPASVGTILVTEANSPLTSMRPEAGPVALRVDDLPGHSVGLDPGIAATTEALRPGDVASILYTSGTTGQSKGVVVTWEQVRTTAEWCFPLRTLTADDVWYCPWTFFHMSGKLTLTSAALLGGQVVVTPGFKTQRFWADVSDYGITTSMIVGAAVNFLEGAPVAANDAANSLRNVYAAPMPADPVAFSERFGVRLCTCFNMTETACPIVSGWDPLPPGSCGQVRPGAECRIVDENDDPVPPGVPGELVIRMSEPWEISQGYFGMPEATVGAWRNLWFHTGDLVKVDEDGYFYLLDRIKDSIRRRGENISSVEVEAEVRCHPGVAEVAAVAVPSELSEDEIKVFLVEDGAASVDIRELIAFLEKRVPRFMIPRFYEIVPELPKTEATMRVQKAQLRTRVGGPREVDRTTLTKAQSASH
ncbi:MAG: hypothetical protein ABS81_06055 [Pseudonocardia sp. SCN 72-86]|nr:MAG: hypothetical protein ABS81_06055 [Pseudonocardia sp. SCN 72-86]